LGLSAAAPGAVVVPKDKGHLATDRVQNPHDAEATYAVKGQGAQKKEHVGFKIQVAETVNEAVLAPGEPTRNFLTGIVTQRAHESDEVGEAKMEAEQAGMGMAKPPVHYVDGAYVSAQKLAQAQAEGREIIGPAQPAPRKEGRFSVEDFQIAVEERQAVCPAGNRNTQCSRLEEADTGKVSYRFEFSTHCHDCPLRERCLGEGQRHRTLVVAEGGVSAQLHTITTYHGPGLLMSVLTGMYEGVMLISHTPVDDGSVKVWHALVVHSPSKSAVATKTDQVEAAHFQQMALTAFVQDIEVWTHKAPCISGMFIPSDGAFMKARIWYKQFYNPRAKKREFLDQCEGVYVPRGIPPYTEVKSAA